MLTKLGLEHRDLKCFSNGGKTDKVVGDINDNNNSNEVGMKYGYVTWYLSFLKFGELAIVLIVLTEKKKGRAISRYTMSE